MIQLDYTIERGKLTLLANDEARAQLRELNQERDETGVPTYDMEAKALEYLIANSELDTTSPDETGDLTDAPMLCTRTNCKVTGGYVIDDRWAYTNYQLRSFVTDLITEGRAVFVNGDTDVPEHLNAG